MDLQRWKLFRELDSSLTSECKLAKIIDGPIVGFLVLQNDDVYAVTDTTDNFKWLGNGMDYAGAVVNQASKVEALCGKGIVDFYGDLFTFSALTRDGSVYSWTPAVEDSDCIADGIPRKVSFPSANRVQIHQVSSGSFHTLCVTTEGEAFGWGYDDHGQRGSGSKRDAVCGVTKLSGLNVKIVQVAAGEDSSYALDSVGQVWSWGTYMNMSLGYETHDDQLTPKLIENLPKIRKIAAGDSHVLALSEKGELYFWGKFYKVCENDEDFDADLDHHIHIKPLQIKKEGMKAVTDIASLVGNTYAVCRTAEKVYLWGVLFQQRITTPVATKFSSIEELFACAESPVMLDPITVKAKPPRVLDAWKRAFNDQCTADVLFSVENEVLYGHSAFLKVRSDYFRSMFENEWEESKKGSGVIKIQGFSFRTFKAFMYFLYSSSLIEPELSVDDLTDLLKAADYYGDEDLRSACENKLKTKLTPENACLVYACAVKSNAENLQNYAVEFMIPVYREVVHSEECKKMASDLKSKLMMHFADSSVFQVAKKRRIH